MRRLDSTEPEEVLTFIETVAQAVVTLGVAAGGPRFRLVQVHEFGEAPLPSHHHDITSY